MGKKIQTSKMKGLSWIRSPCDGVCLDLGALHPERILMYSKKVKYQNIMFYKGNKKRARKMFYKGNKKRNIMHSLPIQLVKESALTLGFLPRQCWQWRQIGAT